MRMIETNGDTDYRNEKLTDQHAKGAIDEQRTAAKLLNSVERDGSRADVDECEDQRDQEGVADGACGLKKGSRVVEDKVDTGPLLHHLEGSAEDSLAQVRIRIKDRAFEALRPGAEPGGRRVQLALVFLVDHDFGKFGLDVFGVGWLTAESDQSSTSLLDIAALDEVPGRIR